MKRKNRKQHLITVLLTALIFVIGLAETSFCRRDRYVSFGPTLHYYDYVERDDNNEYLDSERNVEAGGGFRFPMIGINARVLYTFEPKIFIYANFELTYFNTQYDGYLMPWKIPFKTQTNNLFLRLELNAGYTFQVTPIFSISPYIGFGLRFWSRDITSTAGYLEHYSWFYFPIGFKLTVEIGNSLSVGLDASVRIMFGGRLKAFFIDAGHYNADMRVDLPGKTLYRIEIPVHIYFSHKYGMSVIPWYHYSAIGKSEIDQNFFNQTGGVSAWEPKSKTHQFGINLNFTIYFGNSAPPEPEPNRNQTALKILSR
jgi:hypothetical protein